MAEARLPDKALRLKLSCFIMVRRVNPAHSIQRKDPDRREKLRNSEVSGDFHNDGYLVDPLVMLLEKLNRGFEQAFQSGILRVCHYKRPGSCES
jgi:hypothetical protein